jgi:hypothetical protein
MLTRKILARLLRIIIVFLWLTAVIGFHVMYGWPMIVSGVLFFALPLAVWYFHTGKILTIGAVLGFLGMIICLWNITPSNNRNWATEFSVLPEISISDHQVTIEGFRNLRWHGPHEFDPVWETRSFDLRRLESLDLVVEPFKDSDFMAHTMLRFGFGEDGYLIVSVEARREGREKYSLVAGALRQFELIYLFGSEDDFLTVRAVYRGARLYVFPVKADRKFIVDLFKSLASSANALHAEPQFYRSIRDNCTTTLVKHFDRQQPMHIGLRRETLFPALTGKLLYQMGYMDTTYSYEEAKEYFRVDERIREESRK